MILLSFSLMSCSSKEQPVHDLSYLTISQVMPFLDVSQPQILPAQLRSLILSQEQICTKSLSKIDIKEKMFPAEVLFQGDCFLKMPGKAGKH